jgi:hypothetical protein
VSHFIADATDGLFCLNPERFGTGMVSVVNPKMGIEKGYDRSRGVRCVAPPDTGRRIVPVALDEVDGPAEFSCVVEKWHRGNRNPQLCASISPKATLANPGASSMCPEVRNVSDVSQQLPGRCTEQLMRRCVEHVCHPSANEARTTT